MYLENNLYSCVNIKTLNIIYILKSSQFDVLDLEKSLDKLSQFYGEEV